MRPVDNEEVTSILNSLETYLAPYGFEFQPFKIAWYNSVVQPTFKINVNEDTLAFLVMSTPKMFENAFIPFLQDKGDQLVGANDPIDECMKFYLSKIYQIYPGWNIKIIHDFELKPNRRPKVVMQSIAHASGAAYLYHPTCVTNHDWKDKKMYGVCIHPRYGGWFALRAVIFFDDFTCPDLPITLPYDVVPNNEDRIRLLELYNFHWEDWRFRDIVPVMEKYSDLQIKYFSTPPGKRCNIIRCILNAVNGH